MHDTLTVPPTPPRPAPPPMPEVHIQPPLVYVEPVWEYKAVIRKTPAESPPDEAELNALGAQGWELVGVASQAEALHLYFKRVVR
jgi:hypothetical protein